MLINAVATQEPTSWHWFCSNSCTVVFMKKKKKNTVNILKISTNCFLFFFVSTKCLSMQLQPKNLRHRSSSWASIYEPPQTHQNRQNDCAPSQDSDQSGHPPSLIRVFAVRSMGSYQYIDYCVASHVVICNCITWEMNKFGIPAKDPSFLHADSEDCSDWADAQGDLSLRWVHMPFCWFCHEMAHIAMMDSLGQQVCPRMRQAGQDRKSLTAIEKDILALCERMVYHRWGNDRSRFSSSVSVVLQ